MHAFWHAKIMHFAPIHNSGVVAEIVAQHQRQKEGFPVQGSLVNK
jgi:hypothetical protein